MKQVDAALWQKLTYAPTLINLGISGGRHGVYRSVAPLDADTPYLIFSEMSKQDAYTLGKRATIDCVYQIKAIEIDDSAISAQDIEEEIDLLLTDQPLTVDGYNVTMIRRESGFELPEVAAGQRFIHAGGLYRIQLTPVPFGLARVSSKLHLVKA